MASSVSNGFRYTIKEVLLHIDIKLFKEETMSLASDHRTLERLSRDKAKIEKELGLERAKISKHQNEISSLYRSISTSTSVTTKLSKQKQIASKSDQVARCQKKIAELEIKLSRKIEELNRALEKVTRAERQEQQKKEEKSKKLQSDELRYNKDITRELKKQASIQHEMSKNKYVINISKLPEKLRILYLASNPQDQDWLQLDEEIREVTGKIRLAEYRDSVELVSRWALRTEDLLQALNEVRPHVVHFSGHGSPNGDLIFHSDNGRTKLVSKEAIAATIKTLRDDVVLIVFNTCYSNYQAQAVTKHIDVSIGMNNSITDDAARVFAAQFYSAVGFGRSVKQSFDQAIAALMLEGITEENIPVLYTRDGADPNEIYLVKPKT